jgi:hypothetical protein
VEYGMNERIKELAKAAGLSIRGHYDESGSTPAEIKKFAELIVKQCITQIALIGISNFENDEHGDIGWTVDKSIEMIKDHFGVTE